MFNILISHVYQMSADKNDYYFHQLIMMLIFRSHLDSAYEKYFPVKKANVPIPNDQMEWKHNLVGQNIGLLQK